MKKIILLIILCVGTLGSGAYFLIRSTAVIDKAKSLDGKDLSESEEIELQFGDIVFQSSMSGQSAAIQEATHSKYSHVGILFEEKDEWLVLEAVQPVKLTPLSDWIKNGDDDFYIVKRLKEAESLITSEVKETLIKYGYSNLGKNYDIYFDWSDDELYCSELVWKMYNDALGVELGELKPLKDFDLNSPIVRKIMRERYGSSIPLNSRMISPGDMFNSVHLERVH